jgi:hypothetical protein
MSKKSKRGKSKKYSKSRKYSKTRKSPKRSKKSNQSRKQSKRLKREIELSKEMSKRVSRKTPMIASSQGIKLLKRSKRNMSKGRPLASARDFLLATSILTAALSPYDPHPLARKSKIAPDTQVHLDWHKGQFPDKKLTSKQHKTIIKRSKRGKRLATIKEGGRRKNRRKRTKRTRKKRGGCMQIPKTSDDKINVLKMDMKKMNEYCGYEKYRNIVNEWCKNAEDLSPFLKQMAAANCRQSNENLKIYNMLMADVIDERQHDRKTKKLKRQKSWRTAFYDA